jgi:asparagine synthase (glutamine-hydrolysing)
MAECLAKPMLRPLWTFARRRTSLFSPPWSEIAAIHPAFAARLHLGEAMRSGGSAESSAGVIDPVEERRLILVRNGAMAGPIWHALGAAFNMEVRDPTADVRLLEFCLGVPDEQVVAGGGQRMLIRRAMEGILPPEVQWNSLRGRQAADVAPRLLAQRGEMEATLDRLERNSAVTSCLDLPLMRRVWNELAEKATPRTSRRAATILLRGIMCGCFLEDAGSPRTRE